jgi:hypothetical protein
MIESMTLPNDMPAGKMGNCGIVGTAIFCESTYKEVWETIRKAFRKPGNWKGSSRHSERQVALKALNKKRSTSFKADGSTLNTWAYREVKEGMLYMVRTTCHIQCLMKYKGQVWVCDQNQGTVPIEEYWGRRKRTQWAMCRKVK